MFAKVCSGPQLHFTSLALDQIIQPFLILLVIGQKVGTSPGEASLSQAHALLGVWSKGADGVFEFRSRFNSMSIIRFHYLWGQKQPLAYVSSSRRPAPPSKPLRAVESPTALPASAIAATRRLVTSPRKEADSPLLPEDVRFFDWLFRTSVRTCRLFRERSERGRPCGGVWRGFLDPAPAPQPFPSRARLRVAPGGRLSNLEEEHENSDRPGLRRSAGLEGRWRQRRCLRLQVLSYRTT